MKKTVLIFVAMAAISCRSYNNFMGYATNDNSQCFSDEIFKTKNEEKLLLSKTDINTLDKEGYLDKVEGSFLWELNKTTSDFYLSKRSSDIRVSKGVFYFDNAKIRSVNFYYDNCPIFKEIIYNKQGEIIKDTLYNNYPICWKEALAIAKHRARKEIKKFNVTEFDLAGFVDSRDSIPKWQVILMPDGEETREEYYEYLYEQGGQGADKGERYIVINAQTGEIIKDFRFKVRTYHLEY